MATTSVTLFTPSSIEMTLAELQTSQSNGTLPAGKWVLVTDICDEGGWLFCSSSSQVAQNGFGLFLNCDWQNVGDYTGVFAQTSVAYGGTNSGLWNKSLESFTITYINLNGGTFAVGDPVTGTSGWNGVVLSDNGVDSMTVYSTVGNLPLVGDVIGNGSVTCDATVVGSKTITADVVIWATAALGHRQYQCVDSTVTDGTEPGVSPAYQLLPKSSTVGYISLSNAIEYDVPNGWLQARFDDFGNFWRLTKAINTLFAWGYSNAPFDYFPWGRANYTGCKLDNCRFLAINIAVSFCFNHECKTGSSLTLVTTASTAQFAGMKLGINSVFSVTTAGASLLNINVESFKSFTGKTVTAAIADMYVTENDTSTETLTYPTWTLDGYQYIKLDFSSADLLNNLAWNITGGFEITPAIAGTYFSYWEFECLLFYQNLPYTMASPGGFYSHLPGSGSATLLAALQNTGLNYAANAVNLAAIPQMNVSGAIPRTGVGERIMFKLANHGNQTGGDSPIRIQGKYKRKAFAL